MTEEYQEVLNEFREDLAVGGQFRLSDAMTRSFGLVAYDAEKDRLVSAFTGMETPFLQAARTGCAQDRSE